jgi:hypothetical protein
VPHRNINSTTQYLSFREEEIGAAILLAEQGVLMNELLTVEEAAAPMHLRPILLTAYYVGMRKSEILKLT